MAKTPIFVIPHATYDSYTDYWKLVKASGFEAINQDHVNHRSDNIYVVSPTNGDIEAMLNSVPRHDRKCTFVLWFLERPCQQSQSEFSNNLKSRLDSNLDQIWMSDRAMYGLVRDLAGVKFVPMGSDEAIGAIPATPDTYDVTHMSYVWGRRSFINYLKVRVGHNCWGDDRHRTLMSSRFMMNVHQDNDQYHEPLRFALCAAYALPMITEVCADPFPYEHQKDIIMAPYDNLTETLVQALRDDYKEWRDIGMRMFETATKKFRFKNNVEAACV